VTITAILKRVITKPASTFNRVCMFCGYVNTRPHDRNGGIHFETRLKPRVVHWIWWGRRAGEGETIATSSSALPPASPLCSSGLRSKTTAYRSDGPGSSAGRPASSPSLRAGRHRSTPSGDWTRCRRSAAWLHRSPFGAGPSGVASHGDLRPGGRISQCRSLGSGSFGSSYSPCGTFLCSLKFYFQSFPQLDPMPNYKKFFRRERL
jgi:hypothetical protein